jgi:anti-anti-sigma regulatory factor
MRDSPRPPRTSGLGALTIRPFRSRAGLILAGEADFTAKDTLTAAIATLAVDGGDVHLDLTELRFIDASCARELFAIAERRPGVRLIVYQPPASLRRITAMLYPEANIEFIEPFTSVTGGDGAPGRGGRGVPPDIAELILAEHVRIGKLLTELDSALAAADPADPGAEAVLAWETLAGFLLFHLDAAEEVAYQALASAGPETALDIMRAAGADADIREAVEETRLSRPGSRTWQLAVQAACTEATTHIACVESGPLRRFCLQTGPADRRALGRQWVAFMTARALDASAR